MTKLPKSLKLLKTLHGDLKLPAFLPDGTRGVVKSVDSVDLLNAGVSGLVINTYHLMLNGLEEKIEKIGGMHKLMNWQKPIITDSGGFQVMSLIHKDIKMGKITDQGVIFKLPNYPKITLTPEKSIQMQIKLGADILICLDDCTKPEAPLCEQEKSVERTIAWAKRCKEEFVRLRTQASPGVARPANGEVRRRRPLLFAVVQGGNDKKLRKKCAEELIKIGFDGYCFGGFPVQNGKFLKNIVEYVAKLLPDDKVKYAMGIGTPQNIIDCVKIGYNLFDCVIPTREARHQKLYILEGKKYSTINIGSGIYAKSNDPISEKCDCHACQHFSRAYLHHLFKVGDILAFRLATIHNLRSYSMLMES